MKRLLIISLLLVAAAALAVSAENPRDMKFPELTFKPTEPTRFVADNGMVVYFLEYHELPVVSASAYFKGGEVYDPADKAGLAELTATLLRTGGAGARSPEQVDQDLDFIGASVSSAAQSDYLIASINVLKKDLDPGFGIFSDMLRKPAFDSSKVALEVSNKENGILRQNDDSWSISRRVFYQTVYAGHPYGQFPTLATVGAITRDDMVSQHKEFYAPDNCILAMTGDLSLEEAKTLVNQYFGEWEKSGRVIKDLAPASQQYQPGVYYAEKDINQANIRLGTLGLDDKNPDRFAVEVMNFALGGGGFTSRLTGEVRTGAGLAYSVGSYESFKPLGGTFFVYCLTKGETMSKAVNMMLDIIAEVKANGITKEEMDLAKESIVNSYIFNYDTPGELVAATAALQLRGFPADQLQKDIESYKAVTLEDCRRVAAKYLDTSNIALVITGNKELFDAPLGDFGPVTEVSMEIK